jgi:hypothetical protein
MVIVEMMLVKDAVVGVLSELESVTAQTVF